MAVIRFFRDSITITENLSALTGAGITPQPGDTLVFGGRQCFISDLPGDFNYVIAADCVGCVGGVISGTVANKSPSVTILSSEIHGFSDSVPFYLECHGMDGSPGAPGAPGKEGKIEIVNGKPKITPPGEGGPGGDGGAGSPGGTVIVQYCTADPKPPFPTPPTATSLGGHGGPGGDGGPRGGINGDVPDPPEITGKQGKPGPAGPPGSVVVTQVSDGQTWSLLDPISAKAWANYRTEVGLYFFRLFDFPSQILALHEFTAALQLDPTNADAQTLLNRIVQQQTPTGLPRDIGVEIATQKTSDLSDQIKGVQKQLTNLENQPFSLGTFLTNVGSLATSIASVASGVGAVMSERYR